MVHLFVATQIYKNNSGLPPFYNTSFNLSLIMPDEPKTSRRFACVGPQIISGWRWGLPEILHTDETLHIGGGSWILAMVPSSLLHRVCLIIIAPVTMRACFTHRDFGSRASCCILLRYVSVKRISQLDPSVLLGHIFQQVAACTRKHIVYVTFNSLHRDRINTPNNKSADAGKIIRANLLISRVTSFI